MMHIFGRKKATPPKITNWEPPNLDEWVDPELKELQAQKVQYKIDWRTRHWTTGTYRVRRIKVQVEGVQYVSPWVISTQKLEWRWRDYIFAQEPYVQGQPPKELVVTKVVLKNVLRSAEYSGTLP